MKHVWSENIDAIFQIGYPLDKFGVCNWALDNEMALDAIDKLSKTNVAILGGDVYILDKGSIKSTYDNWHCEKQPHEQYDEFVNRSALQSKIYISNFKNNDIKYIFAIVPSV